MRYTGYAGATMIDFLGSLCRLDALLNFGLLLIICHQRWRLIDERYEFNMIIMMAW